MIYLKMDPGQTKRETNVNELELKTILQVLKVLCDKWKCMIKKIFTDNNTALESFRKAKIKLVYVN